MDRKVRQDTRVSFNSMFSCNLSFADLGSSLRSGSAFLGQTSAAEIELSDAWVLHTSGPPAIKVLMEGDRTCTPGTRRVLVTLFSAPLYDCTHG